MIVSITFIFLKVRAFKQLPVVTAKVFDSTFSFQILNNLVVNQKVCNDSSKRNNSTIFHSEGISGTPHSIPHVIEDYVNNINLLLSGNAIQIVFLLIVDEVSSMCSFPVIENPRRI